MGGNGLGAKVCDSRGVAVHHGRAGAKLWELGAGVVARDDPGEHLDDFALGRAIVHGFSGSASFSVLVKVLNLASCHALAARGETSCRERERFWESTHQRLQQERACEQCSC